MKQENNVQVFETNKLAQAAAAFIIKIANDAVNTTGRFVIALSGGHTPAQLYSLLSKPPFRDEIPWDKTFVFWGDERCVPSDDSENNAHMAKTFLLDHVDIPPINIYPVPVDVAPAKAAEEYENSIRQFFGNEQPCFDLILLGLGKNGHTASLFPGTDVLFDHIHLIKEVFVPEQKAYRITMTADLVNDARNIIFLIAGTDKAAVLNRVLQHSYEPERVPAQLIRPLQGKLFWFVDNKAAMYLNE